VSLALREELAYHFLFSVSKIFHKLAILTLLELPLCGYYTSTPHQHGPHVKRATILFIKLCHLRLLELKASRTDGILAARA
jgi:Ni,Fe-hydrogenase I cytochrome b subunit